jgi:hypothetical protein
MNTDNTFDIVKAIEKSPITRLQNKKYESKLINKIKDIFSDSQQQIFVASFYAFLNYNSKTDFVIDFDDVWKWTGYNRKNDAKRILTKHFIVEVDYQLKKPATEVAVAGFFKPIADKNLGGAGLNRETIMLSVNTFKKFCLKSNTKKADEIHDYYIKLEELLHETLNEESNELRLQVQKLEDSNKSLSKYVRRKIEAKYKEGNCLYLISSTEHITYTMTGETVVKYFKIGHTNNLNNRLSDLNTGSAYNFEVIEAYYTQFHSTIEELIKELFAKHRVSLSNEFYDFCVIEEIKEFIVGQINYFDRFKKNSAVKVATDIKEEDEKSGEKKDEIEIYISNEKCCVECLNCLPLQNFFSVEKKKKIYQDKCIECYIKEHGDSKQCSKCETVKCKLEFVVDRTKKDGFTYDCRECRNEQVKKTKEHHRNNNPTLGKIQCSKCSEYLDKKMFFRKKSEDTNVSFDYIKQCKKCFTEEHGPSKQCFTCDEIKNTSEFQTTKANVDGLACYCKECMKVKRDGERKAKKDLEDPNKNKKQCCKCEIYLKYNMFFKKYDEKDEATGELYDECRNCYTPCSLQCSKCHEIKIVQNFSKDSTKNTGFKTICKSCTSK